MKHNPDVVRKGIEIKGDIVYVTKDTIVHVPAWFRGKGLYLPDKNGVIRVMGNFAVIQGDNYCKTFAPCFISLTPEKEKTIKVDDIEYIELFFPAGSKYISTLKSIHEKIPYVNLFVGYMLNAKAPWYMDYADIVELFLDGNLYAGLLLESRPETLELLHSMGEMTEDGKQLIRHLQIKNARRKSMKAVPLSNVAFGAATALTKITGSYQSAGLDDALVTRTTKLSATERILRDID